MGFSIGGLVKGIVHGAEDVGKAAVDGVEAVGSAVKDGAQWVQGKIDDGVSAFEHSSLGDNVVGHFLGGAVEGATGAVTGTVGMAAGVLNGDTERGVANFVKDPGAELAKFGDNLKAAWENDPAQLLGQLAGGIAAGAATPAALGAIGGAGETAEVAGEAAALGGEASTARSLTSSFTSSVRAGTTNLANRLQSMVFRRPAAAVEEAAAPGTVDAASFSDALDEMYAHAESVRPQLGAIIDRVAAKVEGEPVLDELKSRARAEEKIAGDYGGDASQIKDLARGSVVVETEAQAKVALAELLNDPDVDVVNVKDRFAHPKPNGYKDANVAIRLDDGGHPVVVEARIQVRSIMAVAQREHAIYEKIQDLLRDAQREDRPLNADEVAQLDRLQQESENVYAELRPNEGTES